MKKEVNACCNNCPKNACFKECEQFESTGEKTSVFQDSDASLRNGIITDTLLGVDDTGNLVFVGRVSYGHLGTQTFTTKGMMTHELGRFISDLLKTVDVGDTDKLKGAPVRVVYTPTKILEIHHFLTEDVERPLRSVKFNSYETVPEKV